MANETLLFCPQCGVRLYMSIRAEITGDAEITHLYADNDMPMPDPNGLRTFVYNPKSVRLWCQSCGPLRDADRAVRRRRAEPSPRPREEEE